jgi:hypothetical protein
LRKVGRIPQLAQAARAPNVLRSSNNSSDHFIGCADTGCADIGCADIGCADSGCADWLVDID